MAIPCPARTNAAPRGGGVARLRSSRRIGEVMSQGQRHVAGRAAVHALAHASSRQVRATAIASRQVGTAVVRNRAKRLLREAARRIAWHDGLDLVLVARRSIVGATCGDVLDDLRTAAHAGDLVVIGATGDDDDDDLVSSPTRMTP